MSATMPGKRMDSPGKFDILRSQFEGAASFRAGDYRRPTCSTPARKTMLDERICQMLSKHWKGARPTHFDLAGITTSSVFATAPSI